MSKHIIHQTFISFKIEASNIEQQLCYWQVPLEKIVLCDGGQSLHLFCGADAGQETLSASCRDHSHMSSIVC
jgi:hypothetical protein